MKKGLFLGLVLFSLVSCKDDALPKPASQLRLDYPNPEYGHFKASAYFSFDKNNLAKVKSINENAFELHYPKMKATIYLTYKPVVNGNIDSLLRDAQKLTYEHVIKADDIVTQPYINQDKKVFGMFSEVDGNAATNSQFYLTDSTKNFVTGSMYFYAKPNFDSILPAASYIKNDMRHLIESFQWENRK